MLGGIRAVCGERVIDRFPTQKTAAILAYLALFPRVPHPREVIAEEFWPEADPESQRHSLRLALSRLRSLLGPEHPIVSSRSEVSLDRTRFVTDVAEFEAAVARGDGKRAVSLYAGRLLPGFYEDWMAAEQLRLEILRESVDEGDVLLPDTLPHGLGVLFGRQSERAGIASILQEGRVVTLTAPGGMGKSRLAAAVAKDHGRAVWVPLADLSSATQAADRVRSALGLPVPSPGFPIEDLIAQELSELGPVLLVIDNAEHLVGDVLTELVSRLARVRGVSLLVTSRRALGGHEETEVPIGPLGEAEGAALFEERTRRTRPCLETSSDAMRALSRRLGGMPLALELAAARAGVQDLSQIESMAWKADGDFGESLGIPMRQRALDLVLRESLALLPRETRTAFDRLSVFRGGFDAQAALAVSGAGLATLETLRRWALIVPYEEPDGVLRFRMPEPLRDVALEGAGDAALEHAQYFADWIEANRADELPPPPREFGQRLALQERERDNIRAALETCRSSDDPCFREIGLRIAAAFWTHWYVRNAGEEMESWVTSLLSGPGDRANPRIQAAAMLARALAIREKGAHQACSVEVQCALTTLRQGARDRNLAFAWHLTGLSQSDLGFWDKAEEAYVESESIWKALGDERNFAVTRHNRAMLAASRGDLDKAEILVREAMEAFIDQQSTYVAIGHATIGSIRRARRDFAGAAAAYSSASKVHRQMGYLRGWAQNERDLGLCLHALDRRNEARTWVEGALAAFRRVGDRHGEATALAALGQITGESWHAEEAKLLLCRHGLPAVGELLETL